MRAAKWAALPAHGVWGPFNRSNFPYGVSSGFFLQPRDMQTEKLLSLVSQLYTTARACVCVCLVLDQLVPCDS